MTRKRLALPKAIGESAVLKSGRSAKTSLADLFFSSRNPVGGVFSRNRLALVGMVGAGSTALAISQPLRKKSILIRFLRRPGILADWRLLVAANTFSLVRLGGVSGAKRSRGRVHGRLELVVLAIMAGKRNGREFEQGLREFPE